jgi:hypothetical protein
MTEQNLLNITIDKIRENIYNTEDLDLQIKNYISLTEKKILIEKILDICVINEEIKRIDFALKEFAYEYMLVSLYTNIEIETEDIIEIYDELKQNNVINNIIKQIPESEIEFINNVLTSEINQIQLVDNSLANAVSKQLSKLVEKLPDSNEINKMIPKISKQINKISPDSFKFLADAVGWKNGDKKE